MTGATGSVNTRSAKSNVHYSSYDDWEWNMASANINKFISAYRRRDSSFIEDLLNTITPYKLPVNVLNMCRVHGYNSYVQCSGI